MKKIGFIFLLIIATLFAQAQSDTAWVTTYGGIQNDWCQQIKPTYDGGYITIGTTNSFGCGNTSFYVIKTDSLCKKEWSKTYGNAVNQAGYSVATTYDHGYAFIGFTDSYDSGNYQVYLVRTDSVGNIKWQKTYGGKTWSFGYSIAQTSDSGFVICGLTYSYPAVNGDMYVIRTDKNGDTLWTRTIGGNGYDVGNSIYVHSNTLYAIVGSTTSFGNGDTSMYIVLLNNKGNVIKDSACAGTKHNSVAYSIGGTIDGGYLIFGNTDSLKSPDVPDQILYKTDSMGRRPSVGNYWGYIYTNPKIAQGRDAQQSLDGNIVTVGTYNSYGAGGYAMDMQHANIAGGWFVDGAAFGGINDEYGNSLAVAKNGNVVFAGATDSYGQGLYDVYLVRVKTDTIVSAYTLDIHNYKDTTMCVLGIASQPYISIGVKVFPNPMVTDAAIIIQGSLAKNYRLNLYDAAGRCVTENILLNASSHGQSIGHLSRNNLSSGAYIYEIYDEEGKVATGKLMVE